MKNRLRSRCLTIPHLSALSYEERKEELTVFIRNWCAKENAVIAPHGWELLLRLDLSKGAYRCLKALLHKAKMLVQNEYSLFPQDDVKKAYLGG